MKLALYMPQEDGRLSGFLHELKDFDVYEVSSSEDLRRDTDMLLSAGGDGTFLSAARIVAGRGIPVLGVNFGRMGFLSEYAPSDVIDALRKGQYAVEEREMLQVQVNGGEPMTALNEVCVSRCGAAMLGVDAVLDGQSLPTYWADGLLVATSSGSTAYSLSVGGPICHPEAKVLIISPVAPHNLNARPLIVPSSAVISLSLRCRDSTAALALDNRHFTVGADVRLDISLAQFSLGRVRLSKSDFIGALRSKLFWGEDVRNET
ncbi:MAG: NAD(+)/NADH kinase [Bacteroidales bacterium]|nr:NAD(+)/NADH kinase [Bacteroidales bacterium]